MNLFFFFFLKHIFKCKNHKCKELGHSLCLFSIWMSGAYFHCHVFKDRTLKTQETPTDNQGNTLIWRLNQEVGGFGVTHRLPLAPHSAKWKCELRLPGDGGEKKGQGRTEERKLPLQMMLLFLHLLDEGATLSISPTVVKQKSQWATSFPPLVWL